MDKRVKKHKGLTAEELKRMADGMLMHEQTDNLNNIESDFEKDALEGFAELKKAGLNSEIAMYELQHKLNQKIGKHKRREMPRWPSLSVAATIALIVGMGAFFIIKQQNHEHNLLAVKSEVPVQINKYDTILVYLPNENRISEETIASLIEPRKPTVSSRSSRLIHSEPVVEEPVTFYSQDAAPEVAAASPIIIDSVNTLAARKKEISDSESRRIMLADSKAVVAKAKMKTSTVEDSNQALAEVVVTNIAKAESPAKPPMDEGEYRIYINRHIDYPKGYTEMGKEGSVGLEFTVEKDGSLSKFKVFHSMGSEFDKPSIRVMKNGPKWTPAYKNGKPVVSKARYYVNFIHI